MKAMHGNSEQHWCDKCSYCATTKKSLTRHMKTHESERSFQCSLCPLTAKTRETLKAHIMCQHDKAKPYKCNQCDFQTAHSDSVKVHAAKHETERNFPCDFPDCRYAGKNEYYLKKHKITHNPNKKYSCNDCDYKTKTKSAMNVHMQRHSSVRAYQ